jgi:hypothetical protein
MRETSQDKTRHFTRLEGREVMLLGGDDSGQRWREAGESSRLLCHHHR